MLPHEVKTLLTDYRLDLEEATEELDWELMADIDCDVKRLMSDITEEQRSQLYAAEIAALKQSYQQVLALAEQRCKTLQQKMKDNRRQQNAFKGYQASLAAGNKEVRANA